MYIATPADTGKQWLKADIIIDAYSRMRISGVTVDPTPEDLELALRRLETMAATWASKMDIKYNFEDDPEPNSFSNVQSAYFDAFSTNLAIRIIPDFNKAVPEILYRQALSEYSNLSGRIAASRARGVSYPDRQPRGSGNTLRWNRWARFYRDDHVLPNANRVKCIFAGDIEDYTANYDSYLNENETIDSYDIVIDSNINLISDSSDDTTVSYRIQPNSLADDRNNYQSQITIVATTTDGRVNTRKFYYQIKSRG